MINGPLLGLIFHWIGGFAAASFYIPYRSVKRWSWETLWLTGGVFSWILAPAIFASLLVPHPWEILRHAQPSVLIAAFVFGALWGVGGLTFGMTMRYLGIALGMAVALGFCTVFGTLVPPIFHGTFMHDVVGQKSGRIILLGLLITVAGIAVSGLAGMSKENELPEAKKKESTKEFNFGKGIVIAMFAGIMSSCMAFGLDAGKPITAAAKTMLVTSGGSEIWDGLPLLIVILLGGFTSNFLWCVMLNIRNRSGSEYLQIPKEPGSDIVPKLWVNYAFCALAGVTWYLQFFFYTMGQAKLGKAFDFSNFTLHMASIIIFSTLWGIALHEWSGTSKRTHLLIGAGLFLLVGATVVIGYGNYLAPPQ